MSVMVVGGNGFVGSHIVRELINEGLKPVIFDLTPSSPLLDDMAGRYDFVQGDATDLGALLRAMRAHEVDRVAALTSLVTFASQMNPALAYRINIGTTLNVLEAARIQPLKRIVYASSLAVYGRTEPGADLTEEAPLKPSSLYGATKVFCEELGGAYARDHGVGFAAVRFPGMWGFGQGLLMKGKSSMYGSGKFANLVELPARGEKAIVPGVADRYELLYVKDARRLVRLLLLADTLKHRAYNAGCESFDSLQDIAALVRGYLPRAEIEFEEGVEFPEGFDFALPTQGHLSIDRARTELGYEPAFKPPEAIRDYLADLGLTV